MPRRNRRECQPQLRTDLPRFCGKCGCEALRELQRHSGQVICRNCAALETRRQADRLAR